MARIEIPKNPDDCIRLAAKVVAKHLADKTDSPLAGISMADMAAKQTLAEQQNNLSGNLYSQAEKATENRDIALGKDTNTPGTVRFYLAATRDLLLGQFRGNEAALGDWGFNVISSPAASKGAVKNAAPKNAPEKPA